MKRVIRFLAHLYPAPWRARYGAEFDQLVEDSNPRWATVIDVIRGALNMQLQTIAIGKLTACLTLGGALVGFAASFTVPSRWIARAEFRIGPGQTLINSFVAKTLGTAASITPLDSRVHVATGNGRAILEVRSVNRREAELVTRELSGQSLVTPIEERHVLVFHDLEFTPLRIGPDRWRFAAFGFALGLALAVGLYFAGSDHGGTIPFMRA
jgi:hypothetical protein